MNLKTILSTLLVTLSIATVSNAEHAKMSDVEGGTFIVEEHSAHFENFLLRGDRQYVFIIGNPHHDLTMSFIKVVHNGNAPTEFAVTTCVPWSLNRDFTECSVTTNERSAYTLRVVNRSDNSYRLTYFSNSGY